MRVCTFLEHVLDMDMVQHGKSSPFSVGDEKAEQDHY